MRGLEGFFSDEDCQLVNLQYWSIDVETSWTLTEEDAGSLQVVYNRKGLPNGTEQDFWLYLAPVDAKMIGEILIAWAKSKGEA